MSQLFPPPGLPRRMTATEFAALPEDTSQRVELVRGLVVVSPRPAWSHMRITKRLIVQLDPQIVEGLELLPEVDVYLDRPVDTVRVPDLVIVASDPVLTRGHDLDSRGVALVVEVLSPGSKRVDQVEKMIEYADARIPHYWIVDPEPPVTATVHRLVNGQYEESLRADGVFAVDVPCPLTVDLDALLP